MAISITSFNPNLKAVSADVNTNFNNVSAAIRPVYGFSLDTTLSTGTNVTAIVPIVHTSLTLIKAYAYVKTAPTGASILIDINKNGSTIWSTQANRLAIAAAATSGTQTSFNTTTFAEGDLLTLDIDQVGSTVAGTSLTVVLKFEHN